MENVFILPPRWALDRALINDRFDEAIDHLFIPGMGAGQAKIGASGA
jgi:hypothetical protein